MRCQVFPHDVTDCLPCLLLQWGSVRSLRWCIQLWSGTKSLGLQGSSPRTSLLHRGSLSSFWGRQYLSLTPQQGRLLIVLRTLGSQHSGQSVFSMYALKEISGHNICDFNDLEHSFSSVQFPSYLETEYLVTLFKHPLIRNYVIQYNCKMTHQIPV
mgnify:CR=1 FL=1